MHPVEVAFESVQVIGPETAELSQPGIDLLKWFWLQPVRDAAVQAAAVGAPWLPSC
jgi:hypothetical protein